MPSQAMQDSIDALRDRRNASADTAVPTLDERRAAFTPGDRLYPLPGDVQVSEVTAGGVPAHWLSAPGADSGRVLLFLHGGGYELGSLRSDGELAARLGRASGMRVLFPEYRLAPEHPFPAAIDDVLAAWRWLRTDQGLSARSIAVAGDSAGGGLAVALLVAARDAGEAVPAAATLMSPTVDLTSSGASMTERADQDPVSTPVMLRQFASDYLAGADPRSPLASPLFASLSGLPPLLIQVGTADLLLSDSERLAAAAAEAGVDVTLQVGEGLPHVLPAPPRHSRGSRGYRAHRDVPAGPRSLTIGRRDPDNSSARGSSCPGLTMVTPGMASHGMSWRLRSRTCESQARPFPRVPGEHPGRNHDQPGHSRIRPARTRACRAHRRGDRRKLRHRAGDRPPRQG